MLEMCLDLSDLEIRNEEWFKSEVVKWASLCYTEDEVQPSMLQKQSYAVNEQKMRNTKASIQTCLLH